MTTLYLTREGLEKLKAQLAECKSKRMDLAGAIEQAREYGDLRENSEYHAGKEAQAMLHALIRSLEDKVARAVVLDDQAIDNDKVFLGATVCVLNKKTAKECSYMLVSPVEADLSEGKISVKSPIGQALLGHSVGETIIAKVPAGEIELEIRSITR